MHTCAEFIPDWKGYVLEAIFSNRLVSTLQTLDEALGPALVHLGHARLVKVDHFTVGLGWTAETEPEACVDCVEKNATKLLNILLLERLRACPVETLSQGFG